MITYGLKSDGLVNMFVLVMQSAPDQPGRFANGFLGQRKN